MGILRARILEWVATPSSRESFKHRDQTQVSHIAGGFFTIWAIREAPDNHSKFTEWSELWVVNKEETFFFFLTVPMACRFSGVEPRPQKWKPGIPATRQPGNSPEATFSNSCWMTLPLRTKTLANTQSVSDADRISCTENMWGLNQNFSLSFNILILFTLFSN